MDALRIGDVSHVPAVGQRVAELAPSAESQHRGAESEVSAARPFLPVMMSASRAELPTCLFLRET